MAKRIKIIEEVTYSDDLTGQASLDVKPRILRFEDRVRSIDLGEHNNNEMEEALAEANEIMAEARGKAEAILEKFLARSRKVAPLKAVKTSQPGKPLSGVALKAELHRKRMALRALGWTVSNKGKISAKLELALLNGERCPDVADTPQESLLDKANKRNGGEPGTKVVAKRAARKAAATPATEAEADVA